MNGVAKLYAAMVAAVVVAAACGESGPRVDPGDTNDHRPDAGVLNPPPLDGGTGNDGGTSDGGTSDGGASDGGTTDGGTSDGGTADGGTPDGGAPLPPPVIPGTQGWNFYGAAEGGPARVLGATVDRGGNLWVAGGADGLYLLSPGSRMFRRFTHADGLAGYTDATGAHGYEVISVAGGPANTVFVGYQGLPGAEDEASPLHVIKSGDADKVVLGASGITVTHFDISSPPGADPHYPTGREKIHDVFRIVYNPANGDVWFGGNHGIAMWQASSNHVFEHHHAAINGYLTNGAYTLLSGDWFGLDLDAAGDVWSGGGHRVAKLLYATNGNDYWANTVPLSCNGKPYGVDVWPDAKCDSARPEERVDDFVQDLTVSSSGNIYVGSIPNGLARINPTDHTVSYVPKEAMVPGSAGKVTSLETDPKDGSIWVGHIWGGITRIKDGQYLHYSKAAFGNDLINTGIPDIQSGTIDGRRVMVVSFRRGVVGVYHGD